MFANIKCNFFRYCVTTSVYQTFVELKILHTEITISTLVQVKSYLFWALLLLQGLASLPSAPAPRQPSLPWQGGLAKGGQPQAAFFTMVRAVSHGSRSDFTQTLSLHTHTHTHTPTHTHPHTQTYTKGSHCRPDFVSRGTKVQAAAYVGGQQSWGSLAVWQSASSSKSSNALYFSQFAFALSKFLIA